MESEKGITERILQWGREHLARQHGTASARPYHLATDTPANTESLVADDTTQTGMKWGAGQGAQGVQGDTGAQGSQGDDGAQGDTGAQGDAGVSEIDPTPDSDHTANGIKTSLTAGENLVFGNVCYYKSDGKMWKADADAIATGVGFGMALETKSAEQACIFLLYGFARDDSWSWTVGVLLYLSETAGEIVEFAAIGTDTNDVVQVLGFSTHANRMLFQATLQAIVEHA